MNYTIPNSLLTRFIWHSAVINLEERLLVPFGGQKSEQLNKTGCAFGETNISACHCSNLTTETG